MEIVEVRSQAELADALARCSPTDRIYLKGNGTFRVSQENFAPMLIAFDDVVLSCHGKSNVRARDRSRVSAHDQSDVEACDYSRVEAHDSSAITALDHSQVVLFDASTLNTRDGDATVTDRRSG